MLTKLNISWPLMQIKSSIEKGTIKFDSYFQRNNVWTTLQKSKLIQTILEGYPIPPCYANRITSEKIFDLVDGRQRNSTHIDFMNNVFPLCKDIFVDEGYGEEPVDVSGKYFSELSEEYQLRIQHCHLTIYYYEDMTEEQKLVLFDRLNGGTNLTPYQKSRAQCPAIMDIIDLSKHKVFQEGLTSKAINDMKNEHLVVKSYIMLNEAKPCLDKGYVDRIMKELIINEDDKIVLNRVYDRIYETYDRLKNDNRDKMLNRKIARKIVSLTHFASIIPITYESIENGTSIEEYMEFIQCFYSAAAGASISDIYNENSGSGSGHVPAVRARMDEIKKAWNEIINKKRNVA